MKTSKKLLVSGLFGLVACGLTFYLCYMLGMVYELLVEPVTPATDPGFQAALRHVGLPLSIAVAALTVVLVFRGLGKREARRAAKVMAIR